MTGEQRCTHRYPDGTVCTLGAHTAPGLAEVHQCHPRAVGAGWAEPAEQPAEQPDLAALRVALAERTEARENMFDGRCFKPYIWRGDIAQCWLAADHAGDCDEANEQRRARQKALDAALPVLLDAAEEAERLRGAVSEYREAVNYWRDEAIRRSVEKDADLDAARAEVAALRDGIELLAGAWEAAGWGPLYESPHEMAQPLRELLGPGGE